MHRSRMNNVQVGMSVATVVIANALGAWISPNTGRMTAMTGQEIIRAMHDRYAKTWYHTLTFTQQTDLRTPADTMVKETWREIALLPGGLRVVMERADGNVIAMYLGDSLYFMKGDSVLNRIPSRNILLIMGFDVYGQPVERTLAVLQAERFPMTPVREDTWDGHAVYVIGGAPGDSTSRQLWIDRDRMLFLRAVQPGPRDSTKALDFRFNDYKKVPGGWVAEEVETYLGGKLVQKEQYSDVRTNVPVDSSLFVVPGHHR